MVRRNGRIIVTLAVALSLAILPSVNAGAAPPNPYPFSAEFYHLIYSAASFPASSGPYFIVTQRSYNNPEPAYVKYSLVNRSSDPAYDTFYYSKYVSGNVTNYRVSFSSLPINGWEFRLDNLHWQGDCSTCPYVRANGNFYW